MTGGAFTVQFGDVDEFVADLRADTQHVERRVVRIACRVVAGHPWLVASAVVAGQLVVLAKSFSPAELDRMRAAMADLSERLSDVGFDVRRGLLESPAPAASSNGVAS